MSRSMAQGSSRTRGPPKALGSNEILGFRSSTTFGCMKLVARIVYETLNPTPCGGRLGMCRDCGFQINCGYLQKWTGVIFKLPTNKNELRTVYGPTARLGFRVQLRTMPNKNQTRKYLYPTEARGLGLCTINIRSFPLPATVLEVAFIKGFLELLLSIKVTVTVRGRTQHKHIEPNPNKKGSHRVQGNPQWWLRMGQITIGVNPLRQIQHSISV